VLIIKNVSANNWEFTLYAKLMGIKSLVFTYAAAFGYCIPTKYVTLSHLRSKVFQRIHKPCMPHHRDTSKCTLVKCIPGKWLHFKKASHFHQSRPTLDVDEDPLLVL